MHSASTTSGTVSLAAVPSGEDVRISEILFSSLQQHCEKLDLRVGETVRCRYAGRASMVLLTRSGRSISLDRGWARFIKVTPVRRGTREARRAAPRTNRSPMLAGRSS
jgi:hypothetical protein